MKIKRLMTIAAMAATLVACTKGEIVYEETGSEIGFRPVAGASTKAPVYGPQGGTDGVTYDQGEAFGVFAYHKVLASGAASAAWTDFAADAGTMNTYIDGGRFAYDAANSAWAGQKEDGGDNPYYWPKTGVLAFAGYSPWGITGTVAVDVTTAAQSPKLTVSGFTQGTYTCTTGTTPVNNTVDLMWFDADDQNAVNLTGSATTRSVAVIFRHACSWIDFNLSPAADADKGKFKILKVTLKNVYTKGSFDSGKCAETVTNDSSVPWTAYGFSSAAAGKADIVLYDVDAGVFLGTPAAQTSAAAVDVLQLNGLIAIPQDLELVAADEEAGTEAKDPTSLEIVYQQYTVADGQTPNQETISFRLTGSDTVGTDPITDHGSWLYGRHYTYNITFGLQEIFISPSVIDWTDETPVSMNN